MIPKTIHYCWFGRGKLPPLAKKCIASWKKYCPDYQIIQWNEDNFDVNCCPYVQQAYEKRKFAFVSDYVRLYVMHEYGGIYLDTDVELTRNPDEFLCHTAFSGFESNTKIQTGMMAAEPGFALFHYLLSYYHNRFFIQPDGTPDTTTNVTIITKMLAAKGFLPTGEYQVVDGLALYPRDFFCPLDDATGILHITTNTAAIHWFNKSWLPWPVRLRSRFTQPFHRLFGKDCFSFLKR